MELHNLKPAKGSVKSAKKIARGQGSGYGGTSTRGHKGAKSRSGYSRKRAFEGGQMPLQMRLPKRGFKNPNRKEYVVINLDWLSMYVEKYASKNITIEELFKNGIIKRNDKVKILGRGEINDTIKIEAHAYSETAKKAIEEKGGNIEII